MTVGKRIERVRTDLIKIREAVPASRANRILIGALLTAEKSANDLDFYLLKEHKNDES